jgi:dipeptidyl aminopeptidase/acylaminoacyl peptidase
MKPRILAAIFAIAACAAAPGATADRTPRALDIHDISGWKRIQSPIVSNDGAWFAYRLTPLEGNSEVVLRNLKDGKQRRFPIGEMPRPAFNWSSFRPITTSHDLAFSGDSKWLAFNVYPNREESRRLKKEKKPIQTKVVLVDLATGKKVEFDKIKRFAFSGEKSSAIALQRYPSEEQQHAKDKWAGSDVILYNLASGSELSLGNVSEFAFDKKGDWLAWIVEAQDKDGNGLELRNMATGDTMALDSAKANYKDISWTDKGDGLAALRGVEDKGFEDKLYAVVAYHGFAAGVAPAKTVYDPKQDASFPAGMTASGDRKPFWTADLSAVVFGIHEAEPKTEEEKAEGRHGAKESDEPDLPTLILWHWKDKRLPSMQQVQENADKHFSYLAEYRPEDNKFIRLADEQVRQMAMTPEYRYAIGTDVRAYELETNLDGRKYQDVYYVDLKTGRRQLALRKARWYEGPSPDGSHLLYFENGNYFCYDIPTGRTYNLTAHIPSTFWNTEDDHNQVKPPVRMIGWAKDSTSVLLSDAWDVWNVPADGGAATNLTRNGKSEKIRYRRYFKLDPEEKGIDTGKPLYFSAYGEWTKKGGIARVEPGKPGAHMLHWDDAVYADLVKAKNADVYLYTRETDSTFPDFHVADASLDGGAAVTDADPQQKDFLWSKGVKLVEYTGARGNRLQGALFLPAGYEAGKKYPTLVYIYEKLSQNANAYLSPGYNGFNAALYTSNGYAVLEPDIEYRLNDPGVSSVECILAALRAAEATGVVDPARVGLQGHSWGGYQTAFAVTQTDTFKAAVAGAPLTDMISMYSLIYWNTGSANQPIFERSQGRFTSGYWDDMDAYVRNSPVYHATNVHTPLMILTDDKDGAVDHTQGIEYFNTLRRLGKPVIMLEYVGENHGLRQPANMKDYTIRMKEFFDHYLMDKPAPDWMVKGVPLIKMKHELETREKLVTGAPAAASMR